MPYTPELSREAVCSLRRLAWAIGKPMTKTLEEAVYKRCKQVNREDVCASCKDHLCDICCFKPHNSKRNAASRKFSKVER